MKENWTESDLPFSILDFDKGEKNSFLDEGVNDLSRFPIIETGSLRLTLRFRVDLIYCSAIRASNFLNLILNSQIRIHFSIRCFGVNQRNHP